MTSFLPGFPPVSQAPWRPFACLWLHCWEETSEAAGLLATVSHEALWLQPVKVSQTALMLPAETPLPRANKTAGAGCACVHVEQMLRL